MTDNEIIKALECRVKSNCPKCPYFQSYPCDKCKKLDKDTLDLINRLQAEVERLKSPFVKMYEQFEDKIKAEAYKEFYEELHTEILKARDSNFKAKEERIAKSKEYGIPIDVDDNFLMYCDGKIHALDGIDYFAYETLKEMESANND